MREADSELAVTEMEPSIEMAEDLKEPGIGGGSVGDSGTEINTSGVVEDQQREHQQKQEAEESVETESSIQEPLAEAVEIVASGSECRQELPQNGAVRLSNSSSNLASREIEQENIKQTLHEIISEIDREMEADFSNEEVSLFSKWQREIIIHVRAQQLECL